MTLKESPAAILRYSSAVLVVLVAIVLRVLIHPLIGSQAPYFTFFLGGMFTAWYAGLGPALLALGLGAISGTYLYATSSSPMAIAGPPPNLMGVGFFLLVGTTNALVIESMRNAQRRAEVSAQEARQRQLAVEQESRERQRAAEQNAQLHAQLDRQRQQLNDLVASVPGVVWEAWGRPDAGDQRIDFVSSYVEPMLGYSVEQWLSQPNFWLSIVHPDDRERAAREASATFASGGSGANQFRWNARDGRVIWVLSRSVSIRDETGTPVGMRGVTIDITAQKQAEEEVREQRETLATINRVGRALTAELEQEKLLQEITDAARELSGAQFGAFFYNALNEQGEAYMLYTLSGAPREAFSRFPMPRNTALFESTFRGLGVIRLDDVTEDPRHGKNPPYHGMPEGHPPVRSYMAAPVVSRSGEVVGGLFLGHSEAGVFTQQVESIIGGIAAQAAVAIDNARLYEQARSAQEALQQRAHELEEADRQKDEFLALLGHELRTPLAAIRNTLHLMERRSAGQSGLEAYLERVDRMVRRMGRIIDDLQDVSRIARGRLSVHREPVDLVQLVRQTAEDQRGALEEAGQRLEMELPEEPVSVAGDPVRLAQVLVNLLNNASKFSDRGGEVWVLLSANGDEATVTVRDGGIGIDPEMLPLVFDSFAQAERSLDRSRGGLGLGLALVKGLVELHGGQVHATSPGLGQGAEFSFRLPVRSERAETTEPNEETPARSGSTSSD